MNATQSATRQMVEAGGRTAESFGVNRLLGQIYMTLYLSDSPQCLDSLVEKLGVSKASISIACRQLETWGAVRKVWIKGDRKDYYEAETDFGRLLNNGLMHSLNKKLDSARIQIEQCVDMLDNGQADDERKAFLKKRLKEAEAYRGKIEKLLNNPLVKKIL
jgi:DNA-binding transcriptional regulator GbsR (MarR family)